MLIAITIIFVVFNVFFAKKYFIRAKIDSPYALVRHENDQWGHQLDKMSLSMNHSMEIDDTVKILPHRKQQILRYLLREAFTFPIKGFQERVLHGLVNLMAGFDRSYIEFKCFDNL